MTDEGKEWEYWSNKHSFMLYGGVWLERGYLPPRYPELTRDHEFHGEFKNMVEYDDDFYFPSLRS